jgi:hypothetical protein
LYKSRSTLGGLVSRLNYATKPIIDANGPKGMDKFKGQLAHNMLSIQKYLPESSRFEVVDKGLFLTLPLTWAEENHDLKDNLENLLSVLTPLKLAQKSSSIDAG